MIKQLILLVSLLQLAQSLSLRSDIWWSRRNDQPSKICDFDLEDENQTLQAKICGFCFIRCQQEFATCLLVQVNKIQSGSIDSCHIRSNQCQQLCLHDLRVSQIAESRWPKVINVLRHLSNKPSNEI